MMDEVVIDRAYGQPHRASPRADQSADPENQHLARPLEPATDDLAQLGPGRFGHLGRRAAASSLTLPGRGQGSPKGVLAARASVIS